MPLYMPPMCRFDYDYYNWGTNPSANHGVSVTPGASGAFGSWTSIAIPAVVTEDIYWMDLLLHTLSGTGNRQIKFDIGVDPAGGTSYTTIIPNVLAGSPPTGPGGAGIGFNVAFPIFIKAGSQIAIRVANGNATAGTIRVALRIRGRPSNPETALRGTIVENLGYVAGSIGTTFTPGNAADGTWQLLGTTVQPLWWWTLCHGVNNGTVTQEYTYIDLAFGDASNKHTIKKLLYAGTTAEVNADFSKTNLIFSECYCPVPANTNIYVRGRCDGAPDTGYHACAIGIGG
jgi:hypothetical protein